MNYLRLLYAHYEKKINTTRTQCYDTSIIFHCDYWTFCRVRSMSFSEYIRQEERRERTAYVLQFLCDVHKNRTWYFPHTIIFMCTHRRTERFTWKYYITRPSYNTIIYIYIYRYSRGMYESRRMPSDLGLLQWSYNHLIIQFLQIIHVLRTNHNNHIIQIWTLRTIFLHEETGEFSLIFFLLKQRKISFRKRILCREHSRSISHY